MEKNDYSIDSVLTGDTYTLGGNKEVFKFRLRSALTEAFLSQSARVPAWDLRESGNDVQQRVLSLHGASSCHQGSSFSFESVPREVAAPR